jgi:PAS domain S-box-containing protein
MALYLSTSLGIAVLGGAMRTARNRAESSAQSLRRQAAIIDQTYDAVLVWDWDGPITFWNRGAERIYGLARTEALGRVSHDLLRTQTPGGVQAFVSCLEREGSWEGELEHLTRNGQNIIVESRMVLIREAERAYVIEANRDITLRKKAEAALREANEELETRVRERTAELAQAIDSLRETEERFRLLVAGVRDYAILMLDSRGNVVSWNQGAERIKGYRAEEILGQHFSRFYPQEDIEHGVPEQELKRAVADGQYQDEGWRLRKDGSRFWAHILITAMRDDNSELIGFSKVARDMTQSRHEGAALQESQARMGGHHRLRHGRDHQPERGTKHRAVQRRRREDVPLSRGDSHGAIDRDVHSGALP